MNREQRRIMVMTALYGSSPANIAKRLNEIADAPRRSRKPGLYDQQIVQQKKDSCDATEANLRSIKALDPVAAKLVAYEALEPIIHRNPAHRPKPYQGAHSFSHTGGFDHLQATGVHF